MLLGGVVMALLVHSLVFKLNLNPLNAGLTFDFINNRHQPPLNSFCWSLAMLNWPSLYHLHIEITLFKTRAVAAEKCYGGGGVVVKERRNDGKRWRSSGEWWKEDRAVEK